MSDTYSYGKTNPNYFTRTYGPGIFDQLPRAVKISGPERMLETSAGPNHPLATRSKSMAESQPILAHAAQQDSEVEYRDIPGYAGYRAGSDGSIWTRNKKGNLRPDGEYVPMCLTFHGNGYARIRLRHESGKHFGHLVHRLILLSFVGPCPEGMEACHCNGDKQDNRIENLRWDTRSANQYDKDRHGTMNRGERHPCHVLTDEQVLEMRRSYAAGGVTQLELGKQYGIHEETVGLILRRRIWSHLP